MSKRPPKPDRPVNPRTKKKAPAKASTRAVSRAEIAAAMRVFEEGPPIVVAILGQAVLENELEELLRPKFKRKDDSTWARLTGEKGPLDTFHRKIVVAHAFSIVDDLTKQNLNVVRKVRNIFAHSKRLIDFDDDEVQYELSKTKAPPGKSLKARQLRHVAREANAGKADRSSYRSLCRTLSIELMKRQVQRLKASNRWLSKKRQKRIVNALVKSNPFGTLLSLAGSGYPTSSQQTQNTSPPSPNSPHLTTTRDKGDK